MPNQPTTLIEEMEAILAMPNMMPETKALLEQAIAVQKEREAVCCDDWLEQSKKVDGPIILQCIRSGLQYDGIPFRFCPWCGKARPK